MWKKLDNRAFIEATAPDINEAREFLQRLVTNDMSLLDNGALYTFLLNPKGRYLADFFVIPIEGNGFILDVHSSLKENLFKRLKVYAIGSQVNLSYKNKYSALVSAKKYPLDKSVAIFQDPRLSDIGFRALLKTEHDYPSADGYNDSLIKLGVGQEDVFKPEKSLPLEVGGWALNAISFAKGCFVGQELTARTKYKGVILKHVLPFNSSRACNKDDDIMNKQGKSVGKVCVVTKDKHCGLAYIYLKFAEDAHCTGSKLKFTVPKWLQIINPVWE